MNPELKLRRKWTLRAHGKQTVFVKKPFESDLHVVTKALIWALYLPAYPNLSIELAAGGRYTPDVVQFDANGQPTFWGEAGQVSRRKMRALVQRHRYTHLVFAKWNSDLAPLHRMLQKDAGAVRRRAPVDLISFPADSDQRFIQPDGSIQVSFNDIALVHC